MSDNFRKNPENNTGNAGAFSEAEQALKDWAIKYEKQPDGSIVVPGNLDIGGKGLTRIPDISSVIIKGDFLCRYNHQLTSLVGSPQTVGGNVSYHNNKFTSLKGVLRTVKGYFSCAESQLISLEHAPQTVGGSFYCFNNKLTSLDHAPHTVGDSFYCSENHLTSLKGSPGAVGGDFSCADNQLTSLEGAPKSVGGIFCCNKNQLTSLEHAPTSFKTLISDFGTFENAIPEDLRTEAGTKRWLAQPRSAKNKSNRPSPAGHGDIHAAKTGSFHEYADHKPAKITYDRPPALVKERLWSLGDDTYVVFDSGINEMIIGELTTVKQHWRGKKNDQPEVVMTDGVRISKNLADLDDGKLKIVLFSYKEVRVLDVVKDESSRVARMTAGK